MRCVPTQVGWKGFAVQPFWAAKHTQGNVRVRSFRAINLAPSVASMSGQDWHTSRSFINPTESLDWGFVMLKHHRWWVQEYQSHAKNWNFATPRCPCDCDTAHWLIPWMFQLQVYITFSMSQVAPTAAQMPGPPFKFPPCWFDLYLAFLPQLFE